MPRTAVIFSFAVFLLFLFISPVLAEGTGNLTISLKDYYGNFIYVNQAAEGIGYCLDQPCIGWNDIAILIKNAAGSQILVDNKPSTTNHYSLSPGSYNIRVTGRMFGYGSPPWITLFLSTTIENGQQTTITAELGEKPPVENKPPAAKLADLTPISLGYSNPIVGNPTEVGATIANIGNADAENVAVEFYVDNIWKETGFVNVSANSQQKLTFNWIPEKNGTHNITIDIDPKNEIAEIDEKNNRVDFSVDVLDNSDISPIPIFGPENFYATNKITTYKLLSSRCIPNLGGKNCDWDPEEYIFSVPPDSSLLQVHASVLKLNPLAHKPEIEEGVRSTFLLREPTGKLTFSNVSEQLEYEQEIKITDPKPGEWKFVPLNIEGKKSDMIEASIRTYSKKTQDDKNLKLSIPIDKIFVTNQFNNYGSFLWSGHVDISVPSELKDSGEIIVDMKGYVDNQKEQNVWGDVGTVDFIRKVRSRTDVWIGSLGVLIGKPESVGYGGVDGAVNLFRSVINFFSGEFPGKLEEIPRISKKVFVDVLFSGWDILKTIVETPVTDTDGSHAFGELNGLWSDHTYEFPVFANEVGNHDIYISSILEPSDINLWGGYDSGSGQFVNAKDKKKMLILFDDKIKVSSEPEKFIFKMLSDMSLKMEGLITQTTVSQNKTLSASLPAGIYNITASIPNNTLSVKFFDANITENITDFIKLDNVPAATQNLNLPTKHEFTNVYSVDMPLNFSYAMLTINYTEPTTIKETNLKPYKCNSTYYNYSARTCEDGKWIEIPSQFYTQNITENTFTINLTSFSGFAIGGKIPDSPQYSPSGGSGGSSGSSYDDAIFLKNTTTTKPPTTTTTTTAIETTTTTLPAQKNDVVESNVRNGPSGLFASVNNSSSLFYLAAGIFAVGAVVYVGMKNKKLLLNYSFKGGKKKLSKNRKRMR